ncbi:MAG TPA: HAMP domain-containing sensor histidine kinase [Bacteroidales bacterium]|jgi:signal transduction histidine kinase|nr:MAG: Signal-transduction histidine kinase senX3 [Bacteroidetes bacterium ADurb.BinA012]HNY57748.1 HAMP domain-containing sensor histidine kinase [Bacteroidales bacterium]HOH15094.1 HAMP domain-containing sensor histidine kinase [Bacteroidales bacterium]HOR10208.1 HAMP domain-containing sensor histidine kinase [Bacteroidales bacterium]HPO39333.1 HAMP domain-containing sensor histidine kinase [Bacteroidales bacterium]
MTNPMSFRRRLFLYYFGIFLLFTVLILAFQYHREKDIKIAALDNRLNDIAQLTDNYIKVNSLNVTGNYHLIDSIFNLIPVPDLRITILAIDGKVLYDSSVDNWPAMENHLDRPEVGKSLYSPYGTAIRHSESTGKDYYYFSRYFNTHYIRIAEEYNINIKGFLKRETTFLVFMVIIFAGIWALLAAVTKRMGKSITMLRDFAARMRRGEGNDPSIIFPKNEIGEIGKEIVRIYNNLALNTAELSLQKEKLIRHLHVLNEGVAFFTPERTVTLSNSHFMVFLNTITGELSLTPEGFLDHPEFARIKAFLNSNLETGAGKQENPSTEMRIEKGGKYFSVRCILFNDESFEVVITDITSTEQNKAMRQQMTSNIAHELKTPIASVRGYLETLIVNKDLDEHKRNHFLEKALGQSARLTDLINDIVTLNKLDETGTYFPFDEVDIADVVKEVCDNLMADIRSKQIKLDNAIEPGTMVNGNRSLIVSVFQNLLENVIAYAGEKVTVTVRTLPGEPGFRAFSFADNGVGIPAEHQERIFERFYRIDDGRSRKNGGTGLGLAIVKNAVLLHRGEISVRTRPGGGAEFIFSLPA